GPHTQGAGAGWFDFPLRHDDRLRPARRRRVGVEGTVRHVRAGPDRSDVPAGGPPRAAGDPVLRSTQLLHAGAVKPELAVDSQGRALARDWSGVRRGVIEVVLDVRDVTGSDTRHERA